MNDTLEITLKKLRLSGLAGSLDVRLQEATSNRLSHSEFLELILQDEVEVRKDRLIKRRTRAAKFRDDKRLDDFDFGFNPKINRKQVYDLSTCRFVNQAKDVLLLGPPGVGKSHIAQAIGHQAILAGFNVYYRSVFDLARDFRRTEEFEDEEEKVLKKYLKPELLIIDDMGMKKLPKHSGEYLLEVIMRRHENRSTVMTSNRPIEEWGKLIGDVPAATAILDRFLQGAEIIEITGKSYRMKEKACKSEK